MDQEQADILEAENNILRERIALLRCALHDAHEALDSAKDNINLERGYCDEVEAEIRKAMDATTSAILATKE